MKAAVVCEDDGAIPPLVAREPEEPTTEEKESVVEENSFLQSLLGFATSK